MDRSDAQLCPVEIKVCHHTHSTIQPSYTLRRDQGVTAIIHTRSYSHHPHSIIHPSYTHHHTAITHTPSLYTPVYDVRTLYIMHRLGVVVNRGDGQLRPTEIKVHTTRNRGQCLGLKILEIKVSTPIIRTLSYTLYNHHTHIKVCTSIIYAPSNPKRFFFFDPLSTSDDTQKAHRFLESDEY